MVVRKVRPMSADNDPVELLRGALAIASPSGEEEAVADYLVAAMRQWGYDRAFIDEAGNAAWMPVAATLNEFCNAYDNFVARIAARRPSGCCGQRGCCN